MPSQVVCASCKVELRKDITIDGEETARTFLSGGGAGPVLIADVDPVTAEIVTGAVVRRFTFVNASVGIRVRNSTGSLTLPAVSITNSVFRVGTAGTAVDVLGDVSPSTDITNNTFYQNNVALLKGALADVDGVTEYHTQLLDFAVRMLLDATSPSAEVNSVISRPHAHVSLGDAGAFVCSSGAAMMLCGASTKLALRMKRRNTVSCTSRGERSR